MKTNIVNIGDVMNSITMVSFPPELILEMSKWDKIIKSPYGYSFYNAIVNWNFKPDTSLRISNHWNFESKGKLHCQTTTEIKDGVWGLGQYDASQERYHIIKTYDNPKIRTKDTLIFKMLSLEYRYKKAIENAKQVGHEAAKKCELSFMNKFYKICEEHLVEPNKAPIFT